MAYASSKVILTSPTNFPLKLGLHEEFLWRIYLMVWMAQEIFVNGSMFSAPVMTSDSRDTQKQGGAA